METKTGSTPSHEVDSNVMESSSRVSENVDPAWEHFSLGAYEKGRNTFICVYCRQTYKGEGINRMKKHLARIKGNIGSCKKVSHDVRYQMLEYMKEFELKKKKLRNNVKKKCLVCLSQIVICKKMKMFKKYLVVAIGCLKNLF